MGEVYPNRTIRLHQNSIFRASRSWDARCKTFRQLCRGRKQQSYVNAGDLRNESRLAGNLRVAVTPNDVETSPKTFEQQRKNVTGMRFALKEQGRLSKGLISSCWFGWKRIGRRELREYEVRSGLPKRESLLQKTYLFADEAVLIFQESKLSCENVGRSIRTCSS